MKHILELSVHHTGTSFVLLLLSRILYDYGFIQINNQDGQVRLVSEKEEILVDQDKCVITGAVQKIMERSLDHEFKHGIIHAHIGESHLSFIRNVFAEELASNYKTVIPVRDPLLSMVSKHIRMKMNPRKKIKILDSTVINGAYFYIIDGFVLIAKLCKNINRPFYLPVDLYEKKSILDRENLILLNLIPFLGVEIHDLDYLKDYLKNWGRVGTWQEFGEQRNFVGVDYAQYLKSCYHNRDIDKISLEIPEGLSYLKKHEIELRPFLEDLGYENLMWWS